MNLPEQVTPWLVLISTFIGTLAAVGTAFFWLRNKAAKVFTEAVLEAVQPISDKVSEIGELALKTADDLTSERMSVRRQLEERAKVTDETFGSIQRRLDAINLTTRRATQTVVEKIDSVTGAVIDATNTPASGDGA
jgi:hypothetical protein